MPRKDKALEKAYLKKYRQTPQYKEYHDAYMKKYRQDHKEELALESKKRCARLWRQNRTSDLHTRRSLLARAKKRAAYKGVIFTLTLDDIILPKKCPILGIPLKRNIGRYRYDSPSLDRLVPEKGYISGNVFVISHRANELKRDGSLEELAALVRWMRRVTIKSRRKRNHSR